MSRSILGTCFRYDFLSMAVFPMSRMTDSSMGEITINTPRDRDGTFDPQVVRKREKILADSLADRIIGLYAIGNSTREISDILEEQFGTRISGETISSITDRVLPEIQAWKSRALASVYPLVWIVEGQF